MDAYNKLENLRNYIEREGIDINDFIREEMIKELGAEEEKRLRENHYRDSNEPYGGEDKPIWSYKENDDNESFNSDPEDKEKTVFLNYKEDGIEYEFNMSYKELSNGNHGIGIYLGPKSVDNECYPDLISEGDEINGFSLTVIYVDSEIDPSTEVRVLSKGKWSDGSEEEAYKCLDFVHSITENGKNNQN